MSDSLAPITEALDALPVDQQINWMRGLGKKQQAALFELAAAGGPLSMDFFYGEPGAVVRHVGTNTLPAFSAFEKHVVLHEGTPQGYNHNGSLVTWFSGPGHFLLKQDGDEVLFDYTALPSSVPGQFPALKANDSGTASLVFGHMVDRVRRVSQRCTIGRAWKKDKKMSAWFSLVKAD